MKTMLAGVGVALLVAVGCGSDGAKPVDRGEVDASTTRTPDAFNGDCSTANWRKDKGSDACWACLCGACAETLNQCDGGCTDLLYCGLDRHIVVSNLTDIGCELRGFTAECVTADTPQSQVAAVTAFDSCLITNAKAPNVFRSCEAECGITYTGDVCERYPEGDAGVK